MAGNQVARWFAVVDRALAGIIPVRVMIAPGLA